MSIRKSVLFFSSLLILSPLSLFSAEDEDEKDRGGIEEVTVTAEKRQSTVSDTSIPYRHLIQVLLKILE